MRYKITSTENLVNIIMSNPDVITKVTIQSDSNSIEEMPVKDFKRDLILMSQSGIFGAAVRWSYERLITDNNTIRAFGCIDPLVGTQVEIHLNADETIEKMLSKTIFEKLAKHVCDNLRPMCE